MGGTADADDDASKRIPASRAPVVWTSILADMFYSVMTKVALGFQTKPDPEDSPPETGAGPRHEVAVKPPPVETAAPAHSCDAWVGGCPVVVPLLVVPLLVVPLLVIPLLEPVLVPLLE